VTTASERVRLGHGLVAEIHRREPDWDALPIGIPMLPTDYKESPPCRSCGELTANWILVNRDGQCIVCHQQAVS
jgi:hypothetical protein